MINFKWLVLILICFYPEFGICAGIKSQKINTSYYQHDSKKGLKNLELNIGHSLNVEWNKNNTTPIFVGGKLTSEGYSKSLDKVDDGIKFFAENIDLFGLKEPSKELSLISTTTDGLNMTHVKYQQMRNGLKVFQGQLILHFNADGSIESMNGEYYPTPIMNTTPSLNSENAIRIAINKLSNYQSSSKSAELMIYFKENRLLLVYSVKLPSPAKPNMTVYIDAHTGEVIKIDDGIRYDGPTFGTGIGLDETVKNINTYLIGGKYFIIDASLPMYTPPIDSLKGVIDAFDAQNDTSGNGYQNAIIISDPNDDNVFNDNERLKAAISAHVYTREVYNVYLSRFNRNSFDNAGGTLTNVLHYGINFNNAFWNGIFMTYGDGDGVYFSNLAGALDVIGHELTHGVTERTANLMYESQPGALNESISDVFGIIVDSTNWLIGEDIFTPSIPGDALRNMQDPHNGHNAGDPGWQPAHMTEFVSLPNDPDHDNGGVHINSGIMNKAFYNVASNIGISKSGLIWYRALTSYFTNNSQFIDARNSCLSASKDLFGIASVEYQAVANGFSAVGIGSTSESSFELSYDDGIPATGVYELDANWELAVRFTPPGSNVKITNVSIYISGDNAGQSGQFTLKMYNAGGSNNMPGTEIIMPYTYTPSQFGWQSFDITGLNVSGDFYVSVKYDGINRPLIGADEPPGNQRSYEYDGNSWSQLSSPNDFTLFMRAKGTSTTGIFEISNQIPSNITLFQNYPNPFNPVTKISFGIPQKTFISLKVFDILGREIEQLVNEELMPGKYTYQWNADRLASGIYWYILQTDNYKETKKLILIK